MALDNLVSVTFTNDEMTIMNEAIDTIERIMTGKSINLTGKQRQAYGRVRYEMEVWINKVDVYMDTHSILMPGFIDRQEYKRDIDAHNKLNPVIDRLSSVLQTILDTNLLLGADLYTNSIAFYRSVKNAARSNAQGASAVFADLKQQFPGAITKKPEEENKD